MDKSLIRSSTNILYNSGLSQELQLLNKMKPRKSSIMTSIISLKATNKLQKARKSEFKMPPIEVKNEERIRNYNDGKIVHPYAMTFYNTILRLDSQENKKNIQKDL